MTSLVAAILALIGAAFILLAAIGTLRFPDACSRLHAAAKAGSFGAVWLGLAVCFSVPAISTVVRVLLVIAAIYLTAPVVCHLIARLARTEEERQHEHP